LFALLGLRGRHEDVHTLSTYGAAGTRNNMGESPLYTYLSTSYSGRSIHDILHYHSAGLEASTHLPSAQAGRPDRTGLFQNRLSICFACSCLSPAPGHIRKALTGRSTTYFKNLTWIA
jgi:hypothetical protein